MCGFGWHGVISGLLAITVAHPCSIPKTSVGQWTSYIGQIDEITILDTGFEPDVVCHEMSLIDQFFTAF